MKPLTEEIQTSKLKDKEVRKKPMIEISGKEVRAIEIKENLGEKIE